MPNQQTPCDDLYDDDGEPICDGQLVRVNGGYVGKVHVDADGKFYIEGWPHDQIIESLAAINDLPDTANIHPTIKE